MVSHYWYLFDFDKEIHWMFADMRESLCNRPINVLFDMLLIPCYTRVSIGNYLWRGSRWTLGRPCVVVFLWGSAVLVVTSWSPTVVSVVISSWWERHYHISSLAIIKNLSDIYTILFNSSNVVLISRNVLYDNTWNADVLWFFSPKYIFLNHGFVHINSDWLFHQK